MIIDDDEDDRLFFSEGLARIDARIACMSAINGEQAIEILKKSQITLPHVIFLDLNMPIMSGQEFLKEIKESNQLRHIPVIIFSTSSNASTIASTMLLGAVNFITKPNRFDDLVDILKPIINVTDHIGYKQN